MSADTVTLNFGPGMVATMTRREYDRTKREVERGYKTSHPVDKLGIVKRDGRRVMNREIHGTTFHSTMRLAAKLGLPFDASDIRFKRFAIDIGKFIRGRPWAQYGISGQPFGSLDDGTYWTDPERGPIRDRRVAKVKRVLRSHLRREPTDKDVDTFVYMYFGSDAVALVGMSSGLQNSDYDQNGRHWRRSIDPDNWDTPNPVRRRNQRRIVRIRRDGRYRHHYHWDGSNSNMSNLNSNSNNRLGWNTWNGNIYSSSNNNNSNASAQYARNKSRVNANKAKNKSSNNRITWEEQTVNNLPSDPITLNTFSNGQKAVKIHPTANHYVSPQTFRSMARTSMTNAFNKNGNAVLFKSPMTRQNVRRSNIKFVILKNKNTGRATKAKKNAANKIGDARRRQLTRRSTLARVKAAAAALKRKRSQ